MIIIVEQDPPLYNGYSLEDGRYSIGRIWPVCVRTDVSCDSSTLGKTLHRHICIQDPFDDREAFRSVFRDRDSGFWLYREQAFLNHHVNKSLASRDWSKKDARSAYQILSIYSSLLAKQIAFADLLALSRGRNVRVEVRTQTLNTVAKDATESIQQLLWEVLENRDMIRKLSSRFSSHVTLCRRVLSNNDCKRPKLALEKSDAKQFNVLVVVARRQLGSQQGPLDLWSPIQLLNALFKVQKNLWWHGAPQQIRLEVVRPGSFDELRKHLRARDKGFFQVVHLDVHGQIRNNKAVLEFNAWDRQAHRWETEYIEATPIAQELVNQGVHSLVLGACRSADVNESMSANLSWQLIAGGLSNVVAMSFNMSDTMAYVFFSKFYRVLLIQQEEVGQAARLARAELAENQLRHNYARANLVPIQDWFVPVFYTSERSTSDHATLSTRTRRQVAFLPHWFFAPRQMVSRALLLTLAMIRTMNSLLLRQSARCALLVSVLLWHHITRKIKPRFLYMPWSICRDCLSVILTDWIVILASMYVRKVGCPNVPHLLHNWIWLIVRSTGIDRVYQHLTSHMGATFITLLWVLAESYHTLIPWYRQKLFTIRVHDMIDDKQNILRIEGHLRNAKVIIIYQMEATTENSEQRKRFYDTLSTIFDIWKRTGCVDHVIVKQPGSLLRYYDQTASLLEKLKSRYQWLNSDIRREHRESKGGNPNTVVVVEHIQELQPPVPLTYHRKSFKELTNWIKQHFIQEKSGAPYLVLTGFRNRQQAYDNNGKLGQVPDWLSELRKELNLEMTEMAEVEFMALGDMSFITPELKLQIYT